ncbi:hypothetical protein AGMMS4957_19400 [Bacteroidia bacterium]|nr:hypothetical protein AGMMS4957_19400 [Bacteroidia bacterium]
MKKTFVFALCSGVCLPFFSACVDHEYDMSEENLDKSIEISSGGLDIDLGYLEFPLQDEITSLLGGDGLLKWDENGLAYFEYGGSFDNIEIPKFDEVKIDPISIPATIPLSGETSVPVGISVPLVPSATVPYDVDVKIPSSSIFTITPQKITFTPEKTKLDIVGNLQGLEFTDANSATIELTITFPQKLKLNIPNTYTKEIPVSEILNKDGSLFTAFIESIDYSGGSSFNLTYSLNVKSTANQTIKATSPKFTFGVTTSNIDIASVDAAIEGKQTIPGDIADFNGLEDNTLAFKNPALDLKFKTNIGANFKLGMSLNNKLANLDITKHETLGEEKTTHYVLSPERGNTPADEWKEFALQSLLNPFPAKFQYNIDVAVNDPDAHLLAPTKLNLKADYSFKLPFEFTDFRLSFVDDVEGLFDENMYNDVLSKLTAEYIEITGDLKVHITGMTLNLSAQILDDDYKDLGIADVVIGAKVGDKQSLSIKISLTEELKKARHLKFSFELSGKADGDVFPKITNMDYVRLDNLKLVSKDGGIEIEL